MWPKGMVMAPSKHAESASRELDELAWDFLCSEFIQQRYADWSIDRRIEAYLRHCRRLDIIYDGHAYDGLTDRVLANLGSARRHGLLDTGPGQS